MKTVVAFDFDGTLTKKDSFLLFIKFAKGKLFLYINLLYFIVLWILFKIKILNRHQAKELIFKRCFKNMPIEKFDKYAVLFSAELDKILRKNVKEKIKTYKAKGHTIVIISASIINWIQPWAKQNNIKHIIATELEIDYNQNLTGKFKTPNCWGIEKVNRLLIAFPKKEQYKLLFYGDSLGDKALMNIADKGYWNYFL